MFRYASGVFAAAMLCNVLPSHSVIAAPPETADKHPAPLSVLANFAGQWKTEATLRRPDAPAKQIETRGTAVCQATLGGRYYEFRAETVPAADSDLQVMTFDEAAGVFRQWIFSSDGFRHEATGEWDETTSTLTWRGKTAAGAFVIEDHWVSSDRLEWNLVRKDAAGKVVQTIQGVVTRAKP